MNCFIQTDQTITETQLQIDLTFHAEYISYCLLLS